MSAVDPTVNGTKPKRRLGWRTIGYWTGQFFLRVFVLIVIGAVLGAILFPIGGLIFETGRTPVELMGRGARFLGFIFMIWAPAVALVACVMKAWKRNHAT